MKKSLIFISLLFVNSAWAQSTSATSIPQGPVSELSTSFDDEESSGWSNTFETFQNQPFNENKEDNSDKNTDITNSLAYKFNPTYSASATIEFARLWKVKQPEEGKPPAKNIVFEDTYLTLTRKDLVSLNMSVLLPTSDDARLAGRKSGLALEPTYEFEQGPVTIGLGSEFVYYDNKYQTVEDKQPIEGEEIEIEMNDRYAITNHIAADFKVNKKWTIHSKYYLGQGWKIDNEYSQDFKFVFGPQFEQSKMITWSLFYITKDDFSSDNPIFGKDVSTVSAGLTISL